MSLNFFFGCCCVCSCNVASSACKVPVHKYNSKNHSASSCHAMQTYRLLHACTRTPTYPRHFRFPAIWQDKQSRGYRRATIKHKSIKIHRGNCMSLIRGSRECCRIPVPMQLFVVLCTSECCVLLLYGYVIDYICVWYEISGFPCTHTNKIHARTM